MTNQFGELLQDRMLHKWITAPDQHADHLGQTLLTRDREVIRAWADARRAEPATGIGKVNINDGGAAIRFAFPGVGRLESISWDDWFRNFDEYHLVFVFEEQTAEGVQSHKYRLVRSEELSRYGADAQPAAGEPQSANHRRPPSPRPGEPPAVHRRSRWRRALQMFGVRA